MKTTRFKLGLLMILAGCLAGEGMAAEFVWDNFESYGVGTSLSGQGNWTASPSVILTNNMYGNPTNMAALPPNAIATNAVGMPPGSPGKIWTDFLLDETVRVEPASLPLVESNTVMMVGMTTGGFAVVYNTASNGWDICTNDARGGALSGLAAGAWARLSVCEDFSRQQVALFLNGRLLRQGIPFITNQTITSYGRVTFSSGVASTGYVDDVYVSNAVPPTLAAQSLSSTTDINGDGLVDAVEIMQYGAIAKTVPGDYATITNALAAASSGDRLVVNGSHVESVAVSNSVTLIGTNVTGLAGLTVIAGQTLTLSGYTSFVITNLAIGSGATIVWGNGTTVTVGGVTMAGPFTMNSTWATMNASSLNYTNDFESYTLGQPLSLCGGQGWGASDDRSVVVTNQCHSSSNAAKVVANSMLSNTVGAAELTKVWTDMYLNDSAPKYAGTPYPPADTGLAVVFFVNTNSHVVVWNSNVWDECATDALGNQAPTAATGTWFRVSVFEDFTAQKVAFFLNGQLLRQQVPFVSRVERYQGISFSAGAGAAYLDDVKIWTNMPPSLTNYDQRVIDLNQDGIPDAVQIAQGGIIHYPQGTVFKIR